MALIEIPKPQIDNSPDPLPLSLLNDFLYCPRRAALKVVEGWREANVHTERGDIIHEHSDLAGYEVVKGVKLLRALPVWSERLGLNGKCDIVEVHSLGVAAEVTRLTLPKPESGQRTVEMQSEPPDVGCYQLLQVEFNLGKRGQRELPWESGWPFSTPWLPKSNRPEPSEARLT